MSARAGAAKLLSAYRDLVLRMDRIRPEWDDPVRRAFDHEFIEPLELEVRAAIAAMEALDHVLEDARRACA